MGVGGAPHTKHRGVALLIDVSLYHGTARFVLGGWVHADTNVVRVGLVRVLPFHGVAVSSYENHVTTV